MYWNTLLNRFRKMTGKQIKLHLEKKPEWYEKIKKGMDNFE